MTAGRPLIFETPEKLEEAVEAYFASCWEEVWIQIRTLDDADKPIKDPQGGFIMEWIPKLDREGNRILRRMKPYSITGLAVALNTSRQTLLNYQERPEFFDTIKKAKDICEQYIEDGMLSGEIPAVPGIFNAKNNYGWADKQEIDNTHRVVEMPTIKKDGKEVKFNIGPDAVSNDAIDEEEGH